MLRIRLTGRPAIDAPDGPRRLAGRKPWALLASVALASEPPSRRQLAERIWPDAADPLAAQRWSVLQVRRALEPEARLEDDGDRLVVRSDRHDVEIDALRILDGRIDPSEADALVGGELLEGFAFSDAPELEHWLVIERARVASAAGAALRWAANMLGRRDPDHALGLLRRATALDPFDDDAHELSVRVLAERGDRSGAEAYANAVERRYAADLGASAPVALRAPLVTADIRPAAHAGTVRPATSARALLEASAARFGSGDYPAAEQLGRRAVSEAAAAGDRALEARALIGLAGALVHTVRGRDHEARSLLERGMLHALEAGDDRLAAEAERELGWIAFLDAEYGAAESILRRAIDRSVAAGDAGGAARGTMILGACQSDRAEFELAERTLSGAVGEMERLADRWLPFAESFLARVRLRTGRPETAATLAEAATARARSIGWLSLLPWPMAVAGEARLRLGERAAARETFDEAYALALEIGDPCWQAFALRGMGLVHEADGRGGDAVAALHQAAHCARRLPDVYAWCEVVVLTDLIRLDRDIDHRLVADARQLAARAPMPDLLATLAEGAASRNG